MYPMDEVDPYAVDEPSTGKVLKKATKKSAGGALTQSTEQPRALPNAIQSLRDRAGGLYEQGSKLLDQEPDMSGMQAFAKQRSQQGDSAMLNALAAQYAGESFQPVQAQFLKKAAAAQDPIKMGSGIITPDGQYLKDPEVAMTKKAEFLMQQAKAYEQMAATAESAQEKAAALRAHNETMAQLRLMGLQIQQQGLAIRQANAANAGGQKPPMGYRYTPDGNLEAIPGGPADQKAQAESAKLAAGTNDLDVALGTLRDAYNRLEEGGGITSTKNGALSNIGAWAGSTGIGQTVGSALGTKNQSARNDIAMARPALLAALMKATGMSAKQMDSNAELKMWLATATDPTKDVESNRKALENIERKYINGRQQGGASASFSAPSGGLSAQEQAELQQLRQRFGRQ